LFKAVKGNNAESPPAPRREASQLITSFMEWREASLVKLEWLGLKLERLRLDLERLRLHLERLGLKLEWLGLKLERLGPKLRRNKFV
jgi:hypothetical protein